MSNPYDPSPTNDPNPGGQDPTGQNPYGSEPGQGAEQPSQWAQPSQQPGYGQAQPDDGQQGGAQPGYGQPSYGGQDPYAAQAPGSAPDPYGAPNQYGTQDPYAQPPYGQNPYGQSPYGAAPSPYGGGYGPAQPHPRGTAVLVLGIVGVALFWACGLGLIPGIIALVLGTKALKEIDANPAAYTNRGNVKIGRILGIVAIVLAVLYWVASIALVASGNNPYVQ